LQSEPILSAEDHIQIEAYFRDLPEKDAVERAAQIFVQRRIARAQPQMKRKEAQSSSHKKEAPRAQWVFDHAEINWSFFELNSSSKPLDATYDPVRERMSVDFNPELKDSIAIFGTKIHELEHHLQNRLYTGDAISEKSYESFMGISLGAKEWLLADEASAMLMEGEFYLAIPLLVRQRLVQFYEARLISPAARRFISHAQIMLVAKSPEDYVRKMWEADRYDPKKALK